MIIHSAVLEDRDNGTLVKIHISHFTEDAVLIPAAASGLSVPPLLTDTGQNRNPLTTIYLEIKTAMQERYILIPENTEQMHRKRQNGLSHTLGAWKIQSNIYE